MARQSREAVHDAERSRQAPAGAAVSAPRQARSERTSTPGPSSRRVEALERYSALAARLLMSQIFINSGFEKILDWSGTAELMAQHGMVAIPFFLFGAILVELLGGFSLLLGWKARPGAAALFLFLIPTTVIFHSFWTFPPEEQQTQWFMFTKNLAIMGGLAMFISFGPGLLSLDARRRPTAEGAS